MGRLEEIPKKQVFNVPEGYFERLPAQVQARISARRNVQRSHPGYQYGLRYALPALVVLVTAIFFLKPSSTTDTESILATVETADLIYYLSDSDISTHDLLESVEFSPEELEAIENEVYDFSPAELGSPLK